MTDVIDRIVNRKCREFDIKYLNQAKYEIDDSGRYLLLAVDYDNIKSYFRKSLRSAIFSIFREVLKEKGKK
jgi:hypothetical protein